LYAGASDSSSEITSLYVSTNAGQTWTTNLQTQTMITQVACSADGTRVALAGFYEETLYSTNSAMTFATNAVPGGYFFSIVSSADGTKLVGMYPSLFTFPESDGSHSPIYRSVDSGVTWTQTGAPATGWVTLACSADGTILAAASESGFAISRDSGATWVTNAGPAASSVACSADGTRFVLAQAGPVGPGDIFTSLDSGKTWVTNNAPVTSWHGVAMSADGSILIASGNEGIYTAQIPAKPPLSIAPSGANLSLSWPLPSTGFVLQQSADLTSTNWVNVTNTVTPTNYWNQVTLSPPASGNVFYRLVNP
jgi:hypothetical protein